MARKLSIGDSFRFGWETFKSNPFYLMGLMVLAVIVGGLSNIPSLLETFTSIPSSINILLSITFTLLVYIVNIGIIHIFLRFADGEKPPIGELFAKWELLAAYIVGLILFGAALGVPLIVGGGIGFIGGPAGMVVFGGIGLLVAMYLFLALFFYVYRLVDRDVSTWDITDTFRYSWEITDGARFEVALFFLAAMAVNLLGILALLVGVLVTAPVTGIALAHFYRQLESAA